MTALPDCKRRALLSGLAASALGALVVIGPGMTGRTHAGDRRRRQEDVTKRQRLIRRVQQLLRSRGYEPGPVDGLWGPRTASALRKFQLDNQLHPDGVLGPQTLNKLFNER